MPSVLQTYIYGGGIGASSINNYIQQGQIGQLIALYHANTYDSSYYYGGTTPGPGNLVNWFPNPYIMGGDLLKNTSFGNLQRGDCGSTEAFQPGGCTSRQTTPLAR